MLVRNVKISEPCLTNESYSYATKFRRIGRVVTKLHPLFTSVPDGASGELYAPGTSSQEKNDIICWIPVSVGHRSSTHAEK
jgi:hypothetical protein